MRAFKGRPGSAVRHCDSFWIDSEFVAQKLSADLFFEDVFHFVGFEHVFCASLLFSFFRSKERLCVSFADFDSVFVCIL